MLSPATYMMENGKLTRGFPHTMFYAPFLTDALEIREFYHQIIDAVLHPAPPSLQNTDGDPLGLTTMARSTTRSRSTLRRAFGRR